MCGAWGLKGLSLRTETVPLACATVPCDEPKSTEWNQKVQSRTRKYRVEPKVQSGTRKYRVEPESTE